MLNLSKESNSFFEKNSFHRIAQQLSQKLYGLNKYRAQLLQSLPKERRAKLFQELKGLERLMGRLVTRAKPEAFQFVKVQVGGNPVLLSQAVLVRRKKVNGNSIQRVFVKGRIFRIIDQLQRLRSNWDTYYRTVRLDTRNTIMGMFQTLNKKYSIYLVSSIALTKENTKKIAQQPSLVSSTQKNNQKSQRVTPPLKSVKKIEPLVKTVEKDRVGKVNIKNVIKNPSEKSNKMTTTEKLAYKSSANKLTVNKFTVKKERITSQPVVKEAKAKNRPAIERIVTVAPKVAVKSAIKKAIKPDIENKKKLVTPKTQMGKELKNDPIIGDFNEEIYLESLERDWDSLYEENRDEKRSKYMDEMVLK